MYAMDILAITKVLRNSPEPHEKWLRSDRGALQESSESPQDPRKARASKFIMYNTFGQFEFHSRRNNTHVRKSIRVSKAS